MFVNYEIIRNKHQDSKLNSFVSTRHTNQSSNVRWLLWVHQYHFDAVIRYDLASLSCEIDSIISCQDVYLCH